MKPPAADIAYLSNMLSHSPNSKLSSPLNQRVTLKTDLEKSANSSSEISSADSVIAFAPNTYKVFAPVNVFSA
jgi:hypothetical protein